MAFISQTKHFGYTVSIDNGTNKVITCSQGSWDLLQEGNSSVSFGDEGVLYKIASKKRAVIEKAAEVFGGSDKIRIDENVTFQLCPSDVIVFTHKQYSIGDARVSNGGVNYKEGDLLIPANANPKYNTFDDKELHAEYRVEEVGESGEVISLSSIKDGVYNSILSLPSDSIGGVGEIQFGGGFGTGLTADCDINLLPEIFNEERTITDIETTNTDEGIYSILYLNSPLPPNINKGKIKVEKWHVYLNVNNEGPPKINVPYTMIKDFTANSALPLIMGNVYNSKTLYNESMTIIDRKLSGVESQVKTLSNQLAECFAEFESLRDSVVNISTNNREDIEDLKTKYDQIGDIYIETGEKSKASFFTIGSQIDELIVQLNELKEQNNNSED
jgi:hypothetical protein